MKYKSVLLLLAVALGVALSSCAPDPVYSYPPEYEKLKLTKDDPKSITLPTQNEVDFISSCQAGDSVSVFMFVVTPGTYITEATYYWSLRKKGNGEPIERKTYSQLAPEKEMAPPMWTFAAPKEKGTYEVHFRAEFDYSASLEEGNFFGGYPTSANYEGASTTWTTLTVK